MTMTNTSTKKDWVVGRAHVGPLLEILRLGRLGMIGRRDPPLCAVEVGMVYLDA